MGTLLPVLQVEEDTTICAAALELGFYLASWGMYRPSGFLLKRTYTIHETVVERPRVAPIF